MGVEWAAGWPYSRAILIHAVVVSTGSRWRPLTNALPLRLVLGPALFNIVVISKVGNLERDVQRHGQGGMALN